MIHASSTVLEYPQDATLTDILLRFNLNNTPPDKPAIIDGPSGEVVFTYDSLRVAVRKFASYLQSHLGVQPGDVVGILSTTKNYFPVAVHGVLAVGGVVSAFNPLYQPNEIAHALHLSKPKHVIVEDSLLPSFFQGLSSASKLPSKPAIHVWSDERQPSLPPGCHHLDITTIITTPGNPSSFTPPHPPLTPAQIARTPAFISFSSGTSGLVKGVTLTHGNVVANIFQQTAALAGMFTPSTVVVLAVPFFHILGLAGFCCQYVCQGAPVVVLRRFDVAALLRAVERDRVTHVNVVPPIALALLHAATSGGRTLSSLRCLINAAAPLKQNVADALAARYGCAVTQWYGMTEASPSLASQREDEVAGEGAGRGSVGRLLPGVEARVVVHDDDDEDGGRRECGVGVPGELLIRGPNLMLGYVREEEEGRLDGARDADGWFRTGDVGYFDRSGYLFLVDRAKEMIKVKGHQVAPAELEAILLGHIDVADAAVCGIHADEEATEYPIAYVALKPTEGKRSEKELQDTQHRIRLYVDGQVAHYKRLEGGVHVLDAIPRNPSGKVLRRLLPANLQKVAEVKRTRASKM